MHRVYKWIKSQLDVVSVVLLVGLVVNWYFAWPDHPDSAIVGTVLLLLILFVMWPIVKIIARSGIPPDGL